MTQWIGRQTAAIESVRSLGSTIPSRLHLGTVSSENPVLSDAKTQVHRLLEQPVTASVITIPDGDEPDTQLRVDQKYEPGSMKEIPMRRSASA